MLWQSNPSPQPPATSALKVPSAEAVRLAALEASWRRDKRVAQRRLFWRWTLWYIQRFYARVLVGLALISGAVYLSDHWFGRPLTAGEATSAPANPSVVGPAESTEAAVPSPPQPAQTVAPDWVDEPMKLKTFRQLGVRTSSATTASAPSGQTDTLSLKPENWLHSKEP